MFALESYIGIEYPAIIDKPEILSGEKGISLSCPVRTPAGTVHMKATFYLHHNLVTNEDYFAVEITDAPFFRLLFETGKFAEGINGDVRTKVETNRVLSPRTLLKPTAYYRKKHHLPAFHTRQDNRIVFRFHITEPVANTIEEIQILCSLVIIDDEPYLFIRSHSKTKIAIHTANLPIYLFNRPKNEVSRYFQSYNIL